jgi:DNA repair protein RadC
VYYNYANERRTLKLFLTKILTMEFGTEKSKREEPHYRGHRQRLKSRFLKDPEGLADYELLELLLTYSIPRRDVKPYAKELIKKFGSIEQVMNAGCDELAEVSGIGMNTGVLFMLFRELSARTLFEGILERDIMKTPDAVIDFVRRKIGFCEDEMFMLLYLNAKNHLSGYEILSEGTADRAVIYPRTVVRQVLKHNATGVIAVHNHPSGECEPSANDLSITKVLQEVLMPLEVRVVDHIIISSSDAFSFKSEGLL